MLKLEKIARYESLDTPKRITKDERVCFISDPYLNNPSICLTGITLQTVADILKSHYRFSIDQWIRDGYLKKAFEVELFFSDGGHDLKIVITTNF